MMKRKKIAILIAAFAASVVVATGVPTILKTMAKSSYGDAFVYEDAQMNYKSAYTDTDVSSEKGMLFYAYDSGAKAEFKGTLNGVFESKLATLAESGKSADLSRYSLKFTDKATGNSFSIGIANGKGESNVYVEINGERGGIVYYSNGYITAPYGYTGLYNSEGIYTVCSSYFLN